MKKTILLFTILLPLIMKTQAQTVTDIDGNVYNTVTIGAQLWMRENLAVTHYANGDPIPNVQNISQWSTLTTGARCYFSNDSALHAPVYGALYNWHAVVDTHHICPTGWHVPSNTELTVMSDFLGGDSLSGGKLKEAGLVHWLSPNTGATNQSNFTALPGGIIYYTGFQSLGTYAYFWSSTAYSPDYSWLIYLVNNNYRIERANYFNRGGMSVRCLCDTLMVDVNETHPEQGFKMYPNPTTGKINLHVPQQFGQTKTLEIFDCLGQLQLKRSEGFSEIDISSLAKGLYFIVITNGDNERLVSKIIKE